MFATTPAFGEADVTATMHLLFLKNWYIFTAISAYIFVSLLRAHLTLSCRGGGGGGSEAPMTKLTAANQKPLVQLCPNLVTFSFILKTPSSIEHGGTKTFFLWQSWLSRMHIYCSIGPPECIFMTSLALKNANFVAI